MGGIAPIKPTAVAHQEGVVALVALVGLGIRDGSPLVGLAPRLGVWVGLGAGLGAGLAAAGALWILERLRLPGLGRLTTWQSRMVGHWSVQESLAVALFSGLAEEALARALLQPLVGLVPAAVLFALLHFPPEREAWFWPLMAFTLGLGLGLIFARWGFPAAAAAHATLNGVGLLRLRRTGAGV